MLEKLNLNSLKTKKKFTSFELELFIELISNYIQWELVLDILRIENNENLLIHKIDKNYTNSMIAIGAASPLLGIVLMILV